MLKNFRKAECLECSRKADRPLRSRRSAELFGKEEKPTDKQKRQVTTCLFAKMSSFDDGAGNEIRKERSDGIAERSEASRFRCNEVSRGREKVVIFLVKIKSR